MRDFKGMKRQRGRNRNGGGGGGNKPQQHNANRAFDSNGPEGIKVRGNAQHVFEKYQQLARDAQGGGDRVLAENYLQHAEHYFRVIRAVQPTRAVSDIIGRDNMTSGMDIDFEDESGAQAYAEQPEAVEQQTEGDNQARGDRDQNRQEPRRDDRPRDRQRDDRPRDERPRDDRPRDERPRDDRPRDDRPREDRPRDRDVERRPREMRDPMAVVEPRGEPAREDAPAPMLRSGDGDVSHAPDFLKAPAEPKPRRRRAPRASGEQVAESSEEA